MFASTATAQRIERAEAETMRAIVAPLVASEQSPAAFVRALGGGVATFVRVGSPMNKIIAVGLEAALDEAALAEVEAAYRERGEPVRVELATLALPHVGTRLCERGYRLLGFENVLARPLLDASEGAARDGGGAVRVERMTEATVAAWKAALVDGFAASDDTGLPVDAPVRAVIETVVEDQMAMTGLYRYLAFVDGVLAGAASMHVHEGVALLTGSATLPAARRRGVQAALIATRLEEARARGAELAVITTAPGSQSQANVSRRGFALAYARAILLAD
jgi:GNAT superfamily N-acetyltransferase